MTKSKNQETVPGSRSYFGVSEARGADGDGCVYDRLSESWSGSTSVIVPQREYST